MATPPSRKSIELVQGVGNADSYQPESVRMGLGQLADWGKRGVLRVEYRVQLTREWEGESAGQWEGLAGLLAVY